MRKKNGSRSVHIIVGLPYDPVREANNVSRRISLLDGRSLAQTPAISKAFSLDGVVTLVDVKNILPRLQEGDNDDGEIDEAFQQIMFSDRIVLNKVLALASFVYFRFFWCCRLAWTERIISFRF